MITVDYSRLKQVTKWLESVTASYSKLQQVTDVVTVCYSTLPSG